MSETEILKAATLDNTAYHSLEGQRKLCKVVSVYDGDTVTVALVVKETPELFKCRVSGVDTPEMRPPRAMESRETHIAAAIRARNRVAQLLTNCPVDLLEQTKKLDLKENTKLLDVECGAFDKYGRLLVNFPIGETSLSLTLIGEEYAQPYDGGTKHNWNFHRLQD